jgi:hypothetical protein
MSNIKNIIALKQQSYPYYSTGTSILTDMDSFPYTRFYRGEYTSDNPIIMEREAGWRSRCENDYKPIKDIQTTYYPNHCFQAAITTVYPCMPEYQRKYADKKEMELQLFRARTNEYR